MASSVQDIEATEQPGNVDPRRPHQKYNPSSDEVRKMYAGEKYNAMTDPTLVRDRALVRSLVYKYNHHPPPEWFEGFTAEDATGPDSRRKLLEDIFRISPDEAKKLCIEAPFNVDYGYNIIFEGVFYANFGFTCLDCNEVRIGNGVLMGPNVSIFSATHNVEVQERLDGWERGYPVSIGEDSWIGGNVTILGPCNIGKGVTVAAGAVVRGDIPDYVVVGGVPAKIIKHLDKPAGHGENGVKSGQLWELKPNELN